MPWSVLPIGGFIQCCAAPLPEPVSRLGFRDHAWWTAALLDRDSDDATRIATICAMHTSVDDWRADALMGKAPATSVVVARVGEIAPGHTKKFFLTIDGREEECFVVNHGGALCAYVNRCCHVPMSLDWIENQFMTEDGQYIQCATHGACYVPDTGECISGPPCGKFLTRVPLLVRESGLIATPPVEGGERE